MTRVSSGTAAPALAPDDIPNALSYSQYSKLHPSQPWACARQWAYRYRLHLPEERSPALALGSAFDLACNTYFERRLSGLDRDAASVFAVAKGLAHLQAESEGTPGLFGSEEAAAEYDALFLTAWPVFLAVEGEADVAEVQGKHLFTLRLSEREEMPVVGYSDRLDVNGTLVDHKFSGSPRWNRDGEWDEAWVSARRDQLLIYGLARQAEQARQAERLTPPLNGLGRLVVTYHRRGLVTPQVRVKELELGHDAGLLQRLGEAARIALQQRYPARPGRACGFCSFVARCRRDEEERGRPFFELIEVPF